MNIRNEKIFVAILTYNRPVYFKQVVKAIPRNKISFLLVVNDGENSYVNLSDVDDVICTHKQLGIAKVKNLAIKYALKKDFEHIFLIEDDVLIKNEEVFNVYIKHAKTFGIHHLNFLKIDGNEKTLRYVHQAPNGCKLGFYKNPQGAFSYTHRKIFEKVAMFDENFLNAFEHIDHEYVLSMKKVVPPFWYFPDVLFSKEYLTTIDGSSQNSTITNKNKYQENWNRSAQNFMQKHRIFTNQIPDATEQELNSRLILLEQNYSQKKDLNNKKLAIIIPYRNRVNALQNLIPRLQEYVSKQVKNFSISVIEQNNNKLFNKGLLNNIGFLLNQDADYFCFHDVDLIPEFSDYSYPQNPSHLSNLCSQFNYIENPDVCMGGVVTFTKEQFLKVNGYPNDFDGWGKEDAVLYDRCKKAGYEIFELKNGRYYSTPHEHRMTLPEEAVAHQKNVEKWRNEKELTTIPDNGISSLKQEFSKFFIDRKENLSYSHFSVNF